ncbi:MAG: hypothetical protein R3F14_35010 [Polyangiaceae bacterium]
MAASDLDGERLGARQGRHDADQLVRSREAYRSARLQHVREGLVSKGGKELLLLEIAESLADVV